MGRVRFGFIKAGKGVCRGCKIMVNGGLKVVVACARPPRLINPRRAHYDARIGFSKKQTKKRPRAHG